MTQTLTTTTAKSFLSLPSTSLASCDFTRAIDGTDHRDAWQAVRDVAAGRRTMFYGMEIVIFASADDWRIPRTYRLPR